MKKTGSKFLDSSAWLSYLFAENDEIKEIIDSDGLYTSVISLFEIRRKFLREKILSRIKRGHWTLLKA